MKRRIISLYARTYTFYAAASLSAAGGGRGHTAAALAVARFLLL